jgi:hypothetical protein
MFFAMNNYGANYLEAAELQVYSAS